MAKSNAVPGLSRSDAPRPRRVVTAVALSLVLAAGLALSGPTASYGAVEGPVPVKDNPARYEAFPTVSGARFGWSQSPTGQWERINFLVQRAQQPPVRLNAPGTRGLSGAITGRRAFYLQQRGPLGRVQVFRYDLRTGKRSPMPARVNNARFKGQRVQITHGGLTASGPWLSYTASVPDEVFGELDLLLLYNRVTGRRKVLAQLSGDYNSLGSGQQLNGNWITYTTTYNYEVIREKVIRYNLRTERFEVFEADGGEDVGSVGAPGVSADGTMYYWQGRVDEPGEFYLVRRARDGQADVLVTLPSSGSTTFVKDRPDGSKAVFYSSEGNIYRLIDRTALNR
jgi:hypothetical protein